MLARTDHQGEAFLLGEKPFPFQPVGWRSQGIATHEFRRLPAIVWIEIIDPRQIVQNQRALLAFERPCAGMAYEYANGTHIAKSRLPGAQAEIDVLAVPSSELQRQEADGIE